MHASGQITCNLLVYNLQLPHITSNLLGYKLQQQDRQDRWDRRDRRDRQDRRDRRDRHLNLTFQLIRDWPLLHFLRCLYVTCASAAAFAHKSHIRTTREMIDVTHIDYCKTTKSALKSHAHPQLTSHTLWAKTSDLSTQLR